MTTPFKMVGAILMIIGTAIGAAILALPLSLQSGGFKAAALFLIITWGLMTIGAFALLEVNLQTPRGSNLITMAQQSLGKFGALITWISYLALVYCLLAAYLSGASDILSRLLADLHYQPPKTLITLLTTLLIAQQVYRGVQSVDKLNRLIMLVKFTALLFVIGLLIPHTQSHQLNGFMPRPLLPMITVVITAFGFAIIIPSLNEYFAGDIKCLRRVVLIGSIIPLIIYLLWIMVVMGVLPSHTLHHLAQQSDPISALMSALRHATHATQLAWAVTAFMTVSVFTSLLNVGLCLFDFLADGLKLAKRGQTGMLVAILTFVLPMFCVIFSPHIFVKGLQFAGIFCTILLLFMPALMALQLRRQQRNKARTAPYRMCIPNIGLWGVVLLSPVIVVLSFYFDVWLK